MQSKLLTHLTHFFGKSLRYVTLSVNAEPMKFGFFIARRVSILAEPETLRAKWLIKF
jgi:hypothetical protein